MSSQATITDYGTDRDVDDPDDAPAWAPGDHASSNECNACGAHVSAEFRRVASDADGQVHACPRCATGGMLRNGAATDPDYEQRADDGQRPLRGGGSL